MCILLQTCCGIVGNAGRDLVVLRREDQISPVWGEQVLGVLGRGAGGKESELGLGHWFLDLILGLIS